MSDASARMCEFEFSRGISEIFNGILETVFMLIRGICPCLVGVYGQHPSDEQPLFPCVCAFGMSASEASAGMG